MKTLRRLLYTEVVIAVAAVTLAFIALFFFFDFVDELRSIGREAALGYSVAQALIYVALLIPNHIYELMPITVLIGSIFVMARFAQSSEFTILRTSGLGPWQALRALLLLGSFFVVFTFAVGDYVAPLADKTAQLLKAKFGGRITVGKTGAWIKEKQTYSSFAVNVGSLDSDARMKDVRIFEFDNRGKIVSLTQAQSGMFGPGESWLLDGVVRTEFNTTNTSTSNAVTTRQDHLTWLNKVSAEMVSAAVLRPSAWEPWICFNTSATCTPTANRPKNTKSNFGKKCFTP